MSDESAAVPVSPAKNVRHEGMVECVVVRPFAGHQEKTKILMHPMDALEFHNLGTVKANAAFLKELKELEVAKKRAAEQKEAAAEQPNKQES